MGKIAELSFHYQYDEYDIDQVAELLGLELGYCEVIGSGFYIDSLEQNGIPSLDFSKIIRFENNKEVTYSEEDVIYNRVPQTFIHIRPRSGAKHIPIETLHFLVLGLLNAKIETFYFQEVGPITPGTLFKKIAILDRHRVKWVPTSGDVIFDLMGWLKKLENE